MNITSDLINEITASDFFSSMDLIIGVDTGPLHIAAASVNPKLTEIIGIYGKSGSGKSTFIRLLSFLLEPNYGEILVDDIKINKFNMFDWYKKISIVPQKSFLFNESIEKNIILENNYNKDLFDKIIKLCYINEFIDQFKKNNIGELGNRLSIGQQQRVGIARGLYENKDIIIFDEPTSSLDENLRLKIQNSIKSFSKNKTILIISHNLEDLKICSRLLNFSDNQIIEKKINEL